LRVTVTVGFPQQNVIFGALTHKLKLDSVILMTTSISKIYSPATKSYSGLLRHLYSVNDLITAEGRVVTISLESIARIYQSIGRPIDNIPIIHVGGTNGKVNRNLLNRPRIYHY